MKSRITPWSLAAVLSLVIGFAYLLAVGWDFGKPHWGYTSFTMAACGIALVVRMSGWETRGGRKAWRFLTVAQAVSFLILLTGVLRKVYDISLEAYEDATGCMIITHHADGSTSVLSWTPVKMVPSEGTVLSILGLALLSLFLILDLATRGKKEDKSGAEM